MAVRIEGTMHPIKTRDGADGFKGQIKIVDGDLVIEGEMGLRPIAEKRSDKSPDYDALFFDGERWRDAGLAWRKVSSSGAPMFSIRFERNGEEWNFHAFVTKGGDGYWFAVNRKRGGNSKPEGEGAPAQAVF